MDTHELEKAATTAIRRIGSAQVTIRLPDGTEVEVAAFAVDDDTRHYNERLILIAGDEWERRT